MSRPTLLDTAVVDSWIQAHPGWARTAAGALERKYKLADFSTALGLVVRIGCIAEKHDHHPDVELGWGSVGVRWSTHDAGGVTQFDLDCAHATDALVG
jgi:4a-hydroxytetrahydrobiopterin dehydratase